MFSLEFFETSQNFSSFKHLFLFWQRSYPLKTFMRNTQFHKYKFTETLCLISVFSLFSIVTFPNGGCASQDASRNGTCYTSEECLEKSGTVSGNCAAGYANLICV